MDPKSDLEFICLEILGPEEAFVSRLRVLVAGLAVAATPLLGCLPAATAAPIRTIYGGTGATGNPGVVQLAIWEGTGWASCSAAMWKPRLLLTAAHCVTKEGGSGPVDRIVVFPPGVSAPIYSDVGPVGASSVQVKQWWVSPDYSNPSDQVQPNDFAVVELASDLAPPAYTRLATQLDIAKWAANRATAEHVGYGLLSPSQSTDVPMTISAPITGYYPNSSLGPIFTTFADQTKGVCPGDSGSPVFLHDDDGSYVLVGTVAGGVTPCISGATGEPHTSNFISMAYLSLLNPALKSAGYAAIPSAPKGIGMQATNRDVTVTWSAPDSAADSVANYQVIDASGGVVCTVRALTCTIPNLPDGVHSFTVRAVNTEGDGDVLPVDQSLGASVAAPGQLRTPTAKAVGRNKVQISFTNPVLMTSAVISGYTVTDNRGRLVCRAHSSAPAAAQPGRLTCTSKALKKGTYSFTVVANTQMGDSIPSRPSRRLLIH
jgi:V8-like Glu-specific endopeptidase